MKRKFKNLGDGQKKVTEKYFTVSDKLCLEIKVFMKIYNYLAST